MHSVYSKCQEMHSVYDLGFKRSNDELNYNLNVCTVCPLVRRNITKDLEIYLQRIRMGFTVAFLYEIYIQPKKNTSREEEERKVGRIVRMKENQDNTGIVWATVRGRGRQNHSSTAHIFASIRKDNATTKPNWKPVTPTTTRCGNTSTVRGCTGL